MTNIAIWIIPVITILAAVAGYGRVIQKFADHEELDRERFGNLQCMLKEVRSDVKELMLR